jgi:hypothetical protein
MRLSSVRVRVRVRFRGSSLGKGVRVTASGLRIGPRA